MESLESNFCYNGRYFIPSLDGWRNDALWIKSRPVTVGRFATGAGEAAELAALGALAAGPSPGPDYPPVQPGGPYLPGPAHLPPNDQRPGHASLLRGILVDHGGRGPATGLAVAAAERTAGSDRPLFSRQ